MHGLRLAPSMPGGYVELNWPTSAVPYISDMSTDHESNTIGMNFQIFGRLLKEPLGRIGEAGSS